MQPINRFTQLVDPTTRYGDSAHSSPFDRIKQVRPDGTEFWSARDLQGLMGYRRWENMRETVARAQQAASNAGETVTSHFRDVTKAPVTGGTPREDFELTRHGAYLVAMNGDPRKPEVGAAQQYFAVRTQQAEAIEQRAANLPGWAVALHALVDQQAAIELEQRRQADQLRTVEARVDAIEGAHNEFTALAYAKMHGFSTARAYLARVGAVASRLMRARGQEPHKRQDATFGAVNVYPLWALEAAFAEVSGNRAA